MNNVFQVIIEAINQLINVFQEIWILIERLVTGINTILDTLIDIMPDIITYTSNMDVVLETFALGTLTIIITLWIIDRQ